MHSSQNSCRCLLRNRKIVPAFSSIRYSSRGNKAKDKESILDRFSSIHHKQASSIRRINKIIVKCTGLNNEPVELAMNKDISTPYTCALHISNEISNNAAVAFVNGQPWDMHRPLTEDCQVGFQTFDQHDPITANKAFWRSCSVVLGSVIIRAFKMNTMALPYKSIDCTVDSGSFAYDFSMDRKDWNPKPTELQTMSRLGSQLGYRDISIYPVDVDLDTARSVFEGQRMKMKHIDELSAKCDQVSLYKLGGFIDIVDGPLISNTNQLGRFNVTAVHKIGETDHGYLYRMQGVALPRLLTMHSWSYKLLIANSAKLNRTGLARIAAQSSTRPQDETTPVPSDDDLPKEELLQHSGQAS